MTNLTKKELLDRAKALEIVGRHDMTKDQLEAAIRASDKVDGEATKTGYDAEIVKSAKRRLPSLNARGDDGKVIRSGRNLSGNVPFRAKLYYLDRAVADESRWTPEYRVAYGAAPAQVRLILKYMRDEGMVAPMYAARGEEIAGGAINRRYVVTKIEPAELFAYYRRVMDRLGLKLAESDDEGEVAETEENEVEENEDQDEEV